MGMRANYYRAAQMPGGVGAGLVQGLRHLLDAYFQKADNDAARAERDAERMARERAAKDPLAIMQRKAELYRLMYPERKAPDARAFTDESGTLDRDAHNRAVADTDYSNEWNSRALAAFVRGKMAELESPTDWRKRMAPEQPAPAVGVRLADGFGREVANAKPGGPLGTIAQLIRSMAAQPQAAPVAPAAQRQATPLVPPIAAVEAPAPAPAQPSAPQAPGGLAAGAADYIRSLNDPKATPARPGLAEAAQAARGSPLHTIAAMAREVPPAQRATFDRIAPLLARAESGDQSAFAELHAAKSGPDGAMVTSLLSEYASRTGRR